MPPRRRNGNSQNKFSSVDSLHDAEKAHDSETLLDLLEPEPCQPSQLTMQMALKAAEGVPSEVTANKAPPNPPLSLEDKGPVRTGHSRSPVLAREPTVLQSLTRTIRNYVPSSVPLSIPIPTAAPSPPAVSRPVSFGSFSQPRTVSHHTEPTDSDLPPFDGGVFASDEDLEGIGVLRRKANPYPTSPGSEQHDEIIWSKWDRSQGYLLLILGYTGGIQIWDCTDLRNAQEILNLKAGRVLTASVLPSASPKERLPDQPLLGMITTNGNEDTFIIYSLSRHHIIQSLTIPGLYTFNSTGQFIVLSSVNPPTLHILSASTFTTLFVIPSTQLSLSSISRKQGPTSHQHSVLLDHPRPVFAISHRLLAYVSSHPPPAEFPEARYRGPSTSVEHLSFDGSPSSTSSSRPSPPNPRFGVPFTQADIGNAAYRVGGTVLSGMMSLGGMAMSAATKAGEQVRARANSSFSEPGSGFGAYPHSVSAPVQGRRSSPPFNNIITSTPSSVPHDFLGRQDGHYIVILDLTNLSSESTPKTLTHFCALKHQVIHGLSFSADGTSLVVSPADGQVLKVYRISPRSPMHHGNHPQQEHVYNLHRGRTSAAIESTETTNDGRWLAVGTSHRTIHVFPTNPFAGKPDIRGHMEGKVLNTGTVRPPLTELHPIVRLRSHKSLAPDQVRVPLSFVFLSPSDAPLPGHLLPPLVSNSPYLRPTISGEEGGSLPEPVSPRYRTLPRNYQDVLVFDPADGNLSLRRFIVDIRAGDASLSSGSSNLSSVANRLTPSPKVSVLSQMMEPSSEMIGKETIVAKWNLARSHDWEEVKVPFGSSLPWKVRSPVTRSVNDRKTNWLAEAELSTCSRSLRVLPRSVYLSHQFFFYTLGEDYHTLIRLYRLGVIGDKLDVRQEVEISMHDGRSSSSFVEGFTSRGTSASTSFNEPLASALSAQLDHSRTSSVLPMFPNGPTSSRPLSFRNAIPIRTVAAGLSDGMSEGIGRIRREMNRARSPRSSNIPSSAVNPQSGERVPLEFDEEDEDFNLNGQASAQVATDVPVFPEYKVRPVEESPPAVSPGSPIPEEAAFIGGTDETWTEDTWDPTDNQVNEEVMDERLDDDTVVGLLEEEQEDLMKPQNGVQEEMVRVPPENGFKKARGKKSKKK
jgi:hypothetical protein